MGMELEERLVEYGYVCTPTGKKLALHRLVTATAARMLPGAVIGFPRRLPKSSGNASIFRYSTFTNNAVLLRPFTAQHNEHGILRIDIVSGTIIPMQASPEVPVLQIVEPQNCSKFELGAVLSRALTSVLSAGEGTIYSTNNGYSLEFRCTSDMIAARIKNLANSNKELLQQCGIYIRAAVKY